MDEKILKWEYKCIKWRFMSIQKELNKYWEEWRELTTTSFIQSDNIYHGNPIFDESHFLNDEYCILILKRQKKE